MLQTARENLERRLFHQGFASADIRHIVSGQILLTDAALAVGLVSVVFRVAFFSLGSARRWLPIISGGWPVLLNGVLAKVTRAVLPFRAFWPFWADSAAWALRSLFASHGLTPPSSRLWRA